jgi:hypothetical protein
MYPLLEFEVEAMRLKWIHPLLQLFDKSNMLPYYVIPQKSNKIVTNALYPRIYVYVSAFLWTR